MMDDIIWEDPPGKNEGRQKKSGDRKYDGFRDELRADPHRWARLREYPSSRTAHAHANRMRKTHAWKGFQVVARGSRVYVRFVEEPLVLSIEASAISQEDGTTCTI